MMTVSFRISSVCIRVHPWLQTYVPVGPTVRPPGSVPAHCPHGRNGCRGRDANAIVRKVQERYDATRDFPRVTQEMTIASLGKTTTAHGTVAFKKRERCAGADRWASHR